MKHIYTVYATTILFLLSSILNTSTAFAFSGGGSGVSNDPYEISTCDQLTEMGLDINAYYELISDLDCTTHSTFTGAVVLGAFQGSLNGNFHTINGITTNQASGNSGLFEYLYSATIQNLIITNASITSTNGSAAILTAYASGASITRVSVSGSVSAHQTVGGLVGLLGSSGTISESTSSATVNCSGNFAGGLAASAGDATTISNSYATGDVNAAAGKVGGLIGVIDNGDVGTTPLITNCYATGQVTGPGRIGALFGETIGPVSVSGSFATGFVATTGSFVGGIVGDYDNLGTYTSNFYDVSRTGQTFCANGAALSGCTGVNTTDSAPNYFIGNSIHAPMNSWDFASTPIWVIKDNATPVLAAFPSDPTPTPTVIPTVVNTAIPTATPIGKYNSKVSPSKIKVSTKTNSITITVKDTISGYRNYYVVVLNNDTQKLYKKVRVVISNGVGHVTLTNIPTGNYLAYTLITVKNSTSLHSLYKSFQIS